MRRMMLLSISLAVCGAAVGTLLADPPAHWQYCGLASGATNNMCYDTFCHNYWPPPTLGSFEVPFQNGYKTCGEPNTTKCFPDVVEHQCTFRRYIDRDCKGAYYNEYFVVWECSLGGS